MNESLATLKQAARDHGAAYAADDAWSRATVGEALRETARAAPETEALVSGGSRLSYAQYDEQTERLGAALLELGLARGDRVMFQMGNSIDTAVALLGCFKAGLIPVCTLPQHREMEIGLISRLSGATGYIVQPAASRSFDLVAFAKEMMRDHPTLRHLIISDAGPAVDAVTIPSLIASMSLGRARERLGRVVIEAADILVFQLSGGTTGTPKIIPRMHGEYLAYCGAWIDLVGLGPDDPGLWALPLIHNAAMIYHLIPALMQGRKLVLMERFEVDEFLATIERERVAITGSIGPIAAMILDHADVDRYDLSSVKLFTTLSRADAIEAHLHVPVINVYGISEGVLTASAPGDPPAARHGTVGRPVSPHDEFRLLDMGSERDVAFGAVGELAFRGPSSIRSYFGGIEAPLTSDGFFRTGDLMRAKTIAGTIFYSFEGRIKDNIDRGGEKFGPEEVEDVIVRHAAIADAKVVAMPDPVYGEKACAFLIAHAGSAVPDLAGLARFLADHGVARFKIPERVELVTEFPLTRVGKVDRAALRRIIADKLGTESLAATTEQQT